MFGSIRATGVVAFLDLIQICDIAMARSKDKTQSKSPAHEADIGDSAIDWAEVSNIVSALKPDLDDDAVKGLIASHIEALAAKHKVQNYKVLMLYDERDEITAWHADRIYTAASERNGNIFLFMHSRGGRVEPAYLISKTCQRLSANKFVVAVPRKAKSAATLICLGADEVHMGLMSELGPIDPQFGGLPALGMQNALSVLADLACKYPDASVMLGKYLAEKLDLNILGYFNRVTQSAAQYAERLLKGKTLPSTWTPKSLGEHFVNHYKDHSFVIDADEAEQLLGSGMIHQKSKEYEFANAVYNSLEFLTFMLRIARKQYFDYVGSIRGGLALRTIKEE